LHSDEKLTDQQTADRIGQGVTVKHVRAWRHRHGIETVNRTERYDVPPIAGVLQSLLVGSMLGDGRIARNPNSARYMENHTDAQKAYLEWKRQQWGAWSEKTLAPVLWKTSGKEYPGWRLETVSHATLLPWHGLFYPNPGPKQLAMEVVALVDPVALAVWFMDDGSTGWWPRITFGMSPASRAVAYLIFEKFGLQPRWELHRGNTGEFHFHGETQAEHFIELVSQHIPACMQYKLRFGFQGRGYEIRHAAPEARLQELAAQGVPIRRIARELGLSSSVVGRRLEKLGIEHPRKVGRPPL
jgi:hypothetical protein